MVLPKSLELEKYMEQDEYFGPPLHTYNQMSWDPKGAGDVYTRAAIYPLHEVELASCTGHHTA